MKTAAAIFASKLKKYLDRGGISVLVLSKQTGISHKAIYNYASGQNEPSLNNAEKIAKVLGHKLAEFIGETEHQVPRDCLKSIEKIVRSKT